MKKGSKEWYKMMTVKLNTVNIEMKEMRYTWYQRQLKIELENFKKFHDKMFERYHSLYLNYNLHQSKALILCFSCLYI